MEKILNSINNYFYKFYESGSYSINTNTITVKGKYIIGQYVRIESSTLNDGIYKVAFVDGQNITLESLTMQEEEFEGVISSLAIPSGLIELKAKIEVYESENKPSAIVSESFGNYSYSLALIFLRAITFLPICTINGCSSNSVVANAYVYFLGSIYVVRS